MGQSNNSRHACQGLPALAASAACLPARHNNGHSVSWAGYSCHKAVSWLGQLRHTPGSLQPQLLRSRLSPSQLPGLPGSASLSQSLAWAAGLHACRQLPVSWPDWPRLGIVSHGQSLSVTLKPLGLVTYNNTNWVQ